MKTKLYRLTAPLVIIAILGTTIPGYTNGDRYAIELNQTLAEGVVDGTIAKLEKKDDFDICLLDIATDLYIEKASDKWYNVRYRMKQEPGAGLIVLRAFWQDGVSEMIEARGATSMVIPYLKHSIEFLQGLSPTKEKLFADGGDPQGKLTKGDDLCRTWVANRKSRVGKVSVAMLARAAQALLGRLEKIEASKKPYPPAKPAAESDSQPDKPAAPQITGKRIPGSLGAKR